MIVSFAKLALQVPHAQSLKDKRRCVRSIVDKMKARLDVRLVEVGGQDTWQRVELGFAVVGIDHARVEGRVDKIVRAIEANFDGRLLADNRETLRYGDHDVAGEGGLGEIVR